MLSAEEKRISAQIERDREEVVEVLRTLIGFKTVTPGLNEKAKCPDFVDLQRFVRRFLEDLGFSIDWFEVEAAGLEKFWGCGIDESRDLGNMPVVVGKRSGKGGGRSLLLNGHYDVVPPGRVESWKHDPFTAVVEQGRVYGRGASDMKGGIAAMLMALKAVRRAGIELQGDLVVQSVPDEEGSTMGTLACCQRGYRAQAAIIPEPTNMQLQIAMRGGLSGRITVFGRAGHADQTQPHWTEGGAVNAITKSIKVLQALEELNREWRSRPDKRHKFLDPDIVVPTIIRGGEWFVMHPEKVEIEFTTDFIPSTRDLWEELAEKIAGVAATDSWLKAHPPRLEQTDGLLYGAEIDEQEPIVTTMRQVAAELGLEARPVGSGGLTDGVHLINYAKIPTVSIGPARHTAHMVDEFVEVQQLITLTRVLALGMLRWCGGA